MYGLTEWAKGWQLLNSLRENQFKSCVRSCKECDGKIERKKRIIKHQKVLPGKVDEVKDYGI